MKLEFYPQSTDNYQALLNYYPYFLRKVLEIKEILRANARILDDIDEKLERIYNNCFIITADAETIAEWEKTLCINYVNSLTLDQRRRVVISHIIGRGHFGAPEIREIIGQYTTADVRIWLEGSHVRIEVDDAIFDLENLYSALTTKMPTHLGTGITSIKTVKLEPAIVQLFGGISYPSTRQTLPLLTDPTCDFRSASVLMGTQTQETVTNAPSFEMDYHLLDELCGFSSVCSQSASPIETSEAMDYCYRSAIQEKSLLGESYTQTGVDNLAEAECSYKGSVQGASAFIIGMIDNSVNNFAEAELQYHSVLQGTSAYTIGAIDNGVSGFLEPEKNYRSSATTKCIAPLGSIMETLVGEIQQL